MVFTRQMRRPAGRVIRAVLGLALIALGFFVIGGAVGTVVGMVGFMPLVVEVVDFCLIKPLVGGYADGHKKLESRPPESRGGASQLQGRFEPGPW